MFITKKNSLDVQNLGSIFDLSFSYGNSFLEIGEVIWRK